MQRRIALLLPAASYRNAGFLAAARALHLDIVAIADYCHRLAPAWGMGPLQCVPFDKPETAFQAVLDAWHGTPPNAVVAVDDHGVDLAALLIKHWGLAGNPVEAVRTLRDKLKFRQLLARGQLHTPAFAQIGDDDDAELPGGLTFPVVVKARRLSTSRAVIRANNAAELRRAVSMARRIQRSADRDAKALGLLVETFIPGTEHALEGILDRGGLTVLTLFDKPDPLQGPYFEESIYVAPSRLPSATRQIIAEATAQACREAGVVTGPIHAEIRVNTEGVWLLEIAPRSIGGLCGRVLEHMIGESLETLILRTALGDKAVSVRDHGSVGVFMIPPPTAGLYGGCNGVDEARHVPGITDVVLTATPGESVAPAPFGSGYLGFIFANSLDPSVTEAALRRAHRALRFRIHPTQPVFPTEAGPA